RASAPSDRRDFEHDVGSHPLVRDAHTSSLPAVAVRHEQLWMIEWRALLEHARVGQRSAQKCDEIVDLQRGQVQLADLEVDVEDVVLAEVAAAVVELHDLPDG